MQDKEVSPDQESSLEMERADQEFLTKLTLNENQENEDVMEESEQDEEDGEEEEDDEEEEEEEFSFMCGEANTSPIAAEDAFVNGQIKPVFPLFNRDLFFSSDELHDSLPMKPPVKKVFVETNEESGPSNEDEEAEIVGPYCEWSNRKAVEASPVECKKSNSTGFSKIWRFKEFMGRSNSDGRDAFVFLNHAHAPPHTAAMETAAAEDSGKGKKEKKKKSGKGKTASSSAHEAYLKSKAKDGERRRSYLPYRPELMGFFTNVSGGMSKNVHPF